MPVAIELEAVAQGFLLRPLRLTHVRGPTFVKMANSDAGAKRCVDCAAMSADSGTNGSFRCQMCNTLKSRLQRVLKGMDPDTQSLFREMKKACKNKYYADSHTLMG